MSGIARTLDSLGQRLRQTGAVAAASKSALEAVYSRYDSLRDRAAQDEAALQKRIKTLEENVSQEWGGYVISFSDQPPFSKACVSEGFVWYACLGCCASRGEVGITRFLNINPRVV